MEENIAIKRSDLERLLHSWEHSARRLFWDAQKDKSTVPATRAMEHDAIIYANCARELRQIIGRISPSPSLLNTQEGDQR